MRYEFVLASEQVKYGNHGVFGRAFGEVGLAFDDAEPGRKRLFKLSFGRLTAGHLVARFWVVGCGQRALCTGRLTAGHLAFLRKFNLRQGLGLLILRRALLDEIDEFVHAVYVPLLWADTGQAEQGVPVVGFFFKIDL